MTLSVIISLVIIGHSFAITYYVGNDGDDSNNGTSTETPWQHLSKACTTSAISAGDTIFIMGGVYSEQRTTHCFYENQLSPARDMWDGPMLIDFDGSEGNEIVYKAFPDSSRPVIDGSGSMSIACCLYACSYIVLDGLEFKNSFKGGIYIVPDGPQNACHNVTIKNCVSDSNYVGNGDQDQNGGGIFFQWVLGGEEQHSNITITACTLFSNRSFENHNASGIHCYDTKNCIFEYNVMYDHPMVGELPGNGICFKEGDTLYQNNTSHDSLIIRYNTIYDCARGIRGNGYDIWIHNNVIYDIQWAAIIYEGTAIANDARHQVYNNTIYNCGAGIRLSIHAGETGWIYEPASWNNIVVDSYGSDGWYNALAKSWYTMSCDSFSDLWSDYNCYWNSDGHADLYCLQHATNPHTGTAYTLTEWQALWADSTQKNGEHSLNQYPVFMDTTVAGGYNLRLATGSPCAVSGRGGDFLPYMGAYPPGSDSTPPGTIEDLNAIPGDEHGEIILTWTAPGDDGYIGLTDHYVIKYSTTDISESNWTEVLSILNPPQPLSPGGSTYFAFDTHEDGHYYYIAMKAYDEVGNVSDLSNVAFSFSAGIMMPIQIETYIDSLSSLVTVSCELVESYQSIYYLFALDSVSVYSNPEFVIDSLANLPSDVAMAVFEGLSDDVNYYWRCCAISTDYTDSSAWTPSIEFNLNFGLISSLAESHCRYPTEGEIVPSGRPYFIVQNPQNISELYFQVDDNDNFSSPVESGSVPPTPGDETRWQLPATDPIEQGITYYWRVSNNNAVWTSPISFSALLEIHPYPNPFRASEGHTNITFTNLPQDSSIMISTISGDIILREDNIGPEDWAWEVKNDRGNNLAPGVYLYAINFPSGSSNGKLLVIR